ncbi:LbetaH domain-containing protein [Kaistella daneshvariae]|nr:hypothetical protein [Kaistella daneshvariae]
MRRIIALILFFPHLMLFFFSKKRDVIIADLYSRSEEKPQQFSSVLSDLAVRLFNDRYFRTLFYFRTSGGGAKFLRIFYPREKYLIIDIQTKLGKGVQLAHPYSTILNAESIGDNLYVNHLVTVGEKNGQKPVIGNNVQLHANCCVIGGVKVGDNAIIGAGAVVVNDVPSGCFAVGNPARIIHR